jgi:hypothetical protein
VTATVETFPTNISRTSATFPDQAEFVLALDTVIDAGWSSIKQGEFWSYILETSARVANGERDLLGELTLLYRRVMVQIYHYTIYNPVNQAMAAAATPPDEVNLLNYVYEHAREESGHHRMIVHDLKSVSLYDEADFDEPPLPATQALVSYLGELANRHGAKPRLGYSYWAEAVYVQIGEVLAAIRSALELTDNQMSFFVAHAEIDADHAEEVKEQIVKHVTEPDDQRRLLRAAEVTLWLTGEILEQSYVDTVKRRDGRANGHR